MLNRLTASGCIALHCIAFPFRSVLSLSLPAFHPLVPYPPSFGPPSHASIFRPSNPSFPRLQLHSSISSSLPLTSLLLHLLLAVALLWNGSGGVVGSLARAHGTSIALLLLFGLVFLSLLHVHVGETHFGGREVLRFVGVWFGCVVESRRVVRDLVGRADFEWI